MANLTFTDIEREKFKVWNAQHLADHHGGNEPYSGAIGGRISYTLCFTSIGEVVKATCAFCKDHEYGTVDMSDYDSW